MPRRRYKRVTHPPEEVLVSSLNHEGAGIASVNGKKTFIQGALPNERVMFSRLCQHSRYDEGKVLEVLEASPERVKPSCNHFLQCGGCALQHMSPVMQMQTKLEAVTDHLQHFGGIVMPCFEPPIYATKTYGYRMKARLGVRYVAKKRRVLIGFRERNGRYLTDMHACEVLHPSIGHKLDDLSDLIGHMDGYQSIPQIEVAIGESASACIFKHLLDLSYADVQLLKDYGRDEKIHIYLKPGDEESTYRIWPEDDDENLHYTHPDHQVSMAFHPSQFIQANLEVNRMMVSQAIDWLALNENETVLDLFCGIGNFSVPIAKYVKHVLAVEGSQVMTKQVLMNAHANGLSNIEAYCHNLIEPLDQSICHGHEIDAVLLDPPRAGASECMPWLMALRPKRILYVSCQSSTFARDARMLVEGGYRLARMGLMDMFPHTSHIETMALFEC